METVFCSPLRLHIIEIEPRQGSNHQDGDDRLDEAAGDFPDEEDYDAQHDDAEGIIKNILVAQHKIQMIRVMIYWNNFLNWVGTGVVNSMGSPVMGW